MISNCGSKSVTDAFCKKQNEMRTDDEPTFFTMPVANLENLTNITKTKEVLYNSNKLRSELAFDPINLYGICQGKRHQVSLNGCNCCDSLLAFPVIRSHCLAVTVAVDKPRRYETLLLVRTPNSSLLSSGATTSRATFRKQRLSWSTMC